MHMTCTFTLVLRLARKPSESYGFFHNFTCARSFVFDGAAGFTCEGHYELNEVCAGRDAVFCVTVVPGAFASLKILTRTSLFFPKRIEHAGVYSEGVTACML